MASFRFVAYRVKDSTIDMLFDWADAPPGTCTDIVVVLTDAELAAVSSQANLVALARTKLKRKMKAEGIANKLDAAIGQTIMI